MSRRTDLGKGLDGFSSKEWLRTSGLFNLKKNRVRGKLLALYSFLRGSGEQSVELYTFRSSEKRCANSSKLQQKRFKLDVRKYWGWEIGEKDSCVLQISQTLQQSMIFKRKTTSIFGFPEKYAKCQLQQPIEITSLTPPGTFGKIIWFCIAE